MDLSKATRKRVDKFTQTILSKAFRGKLVAQDPNDEHAKKLLERIRAEQLTKKSKKKRKKRVKKVDNSTKDLLKILKREDRQLSSKELLKLSAFSNDIDEIEDFFVQLQQLKKKKKIGVVRKGNEDWISFSYEGNL